VTGDSIKMDRRELKMEDGRSLYLYQFGPSGEREDQAEKPQVKSAPQEHEEINNQ
jgi:hypothetical protein